MGSGHSLQVKRRISRRRRRRRRRRRQSRSSLEGLPLKGQLSRLEKPRSSKLIISHSHSPVSCNTQNERGRHSRGGGGGEEGVGGGEEGGGGGRLSREAMVSRLTDLSAD